MDGYDDIELASYALVSLATVDQYGELTGETAIELLMERISEPRDAPRHVVVDPIPAGQELDVCTH